MPSTTSLARRRNAIAVAAGIVNVLAGLTVAAGHLTRNAWLVTLVPGSAPMRLTTAIALLCCGAAVLLLAGGYLRAAAGLAAVCGAIGLANLAEAFVGSPIAAFDPVAFAGAAPPRAGMLLAFLLTLGAAALGLMAGVVRPRARLAMVGSIGAVVHAAGAVAVIAYAAGVSSAFTTGTFSQIPPHTAVALAALGAALIRFAWRDSVALQAGAPAWAPLLIGAGTLATSFCLYGAMAADQESDFAHQVGFEAEGLRQFIHAGLDNRIQPLIRLARHRAVTPGLKKDEWDADAQMILTRGGYQAIEWIDPAGRAVWSTPPGAGDATPDGNAAFEARRRAAFDAARHNRAVAATRPVDLVTGGKGAIVLVPVFVRDELAGYVAGVFRYRLLFQNLLASNPSPRYSIAVYDGGEPIFGQGTPSHSARLLRSMELAAGGVVWKLEIGPTEALALQARSPAAGILLMGGIFFAFLFSFAIHLLQRSGSRPALHEAVGATPAPAAELAGAARLPVVSYTRAGAVLAWNETAGLLFAGPPPRIPACPTGFRTIQATLVRAQASAESVGALRLLLESCAQPVVMFDAEGRFLAANTASVRMLGWTDAAWSARNAGGVFAGSGEAVDVQTVVLMQGEWVVPASGKSAAAAAE